MGPDAVNIEFSAFKNFPVRLLGALQFRAEFFNLSNHSQLGFPDNTVNIPQGTTIRSLVSPMRQIQFGLKALF
jgi:hypothetical protein